jgi:hypothetical protein
MDYNPHVKEITNEYMKKKSEMVIHFFDKLAYKNNVWGYFAKFYRKLLKQTTDTKYFINFFQEIRNYLALVRKYIRVGVIIQGKTEKKVL